ncbi:MAG TPA: PKD domain-containing protein [Solirubrobacterales bacterium]|nr:PKD domain-containing protein [Solirubrobacterales bacterium]
MWRCLVAVTAMLVVAPGAARGAPVASFTFAPATPLTGELVTFTSTSTGTTTQAWDFEDDDRVCDDASGATVQHSFAAAGTFAVTLCVADGAGSSGSQTQPVPVANRSPVAGFNYAPDAPLPGESVVLTSFSADPDGPLVSQAWDLDNDGSFDDGQGPSASVSFAAPGEYLVKLLVADRDGAAGLAQRAISVQAPVAQFMRPFPVVRVIGAVGRHGTRIREIRLTAPLGSRVEVFCRGGGCPRTSARRDARAARTLRIRRFARRLLRPGAVVQISVTKAGAIGKYMRLRIRRGRSPSRIDRCLMPGGERPVRCPV